MKNTPSERSANNMNNSSKYAGGKSKGGSVGVLMMKVVGGMLVAVTIFAFHSGYPSSNPMVYSDWFKNNQLEWSTTYLDYRIVSVASQLCLIICSKTI